MHSSARTLEKALVKPRCGYLTSAAGDKRRGRTSQPCGGSALQGVLLLVLENDYDDKDEDGTGREEAWTSRFPTRDTAFSKFLA